MKIRFRSAVKAVEAARVAAEEGAEERAKARAAAEAREAEAASVVAKRRMASDVDNDLGGRREKE